MKNSISRCVGIILFLALAAISVVAQSSPADLYVGTWKGEMVVGRAVPLEISFERAGAKLAGSLLDPSGKKVSLTDVISAQSGVVFRLDRGDGSFMVFTGRLSADKALLSGDVTMMDGNVERGKAPWKARKVVAGPGVPPLSGVGPTPVQAADERGRMLFSKKDYAGAIAAFSECLKLEPTNTSCLRSRAMSYHQDSKYGAAIADFTALIPLLPKPPAVLYLARAESYIAIEDYDKAVGDADVAFSINGTPDAYLTRGVAHQQAGGLMYFTGIYRGKEAETKGPGLARTAKGLVELNKFIQLKPQDHRGYLKRGEYFYYLWNVFSDATRLPDSIADLDKAITIAPQNANGYYSRYLTYQALGNTAAAAADKAKYDQLNKK